MDLGLQGKVALITGGSKGIGLATAISLSREGAKVAILARNEEQLQEAAVHIANLTEGEVLTIQADVTSEADCQRAGGTNRSAIWKFTYSSEQCRYVCCPVI